MKLKKVISVMLVGACVFSMAACGSKKEEAKKIESADDLKDAKIGVQTGTTGDIYCSDDFGDDHVERFNKGADAVQVSARRWIIVLTSVSVSLNGRLSQLIQPSSRRALTTL